MHKDKDSQTGKRIAQALVRHLKEGSPSSAYNTVRVCHEEGCPDFDDGKILKKVFTSPEFRKLVEKAVEEEMGNFLG